MNREEYKQLVKQLTPKENKLKNAAIAFLVGGLVGFVGEIIINILINSFKLEMAVACTWLAVIVIFIASLFTALGFFDNWVTKTKAGLIVPISGFAHSVTSSAMDYKKDGMISGLGSNFFKLAGSVILYSMIAAFLLSVIKVVIS